MPIKQHLLWSAAICVGFAMFLAPPPAGAQSLIDGYWNPLLHQDAYPYAGGPDPGDFSGLPITEAAREVAQQYDPDEQTMPELQCRPFPATYGPRALSTMRIWETLDPESQEQTKIESWISFAAQHRVIWMPASHRPNPPFSAPNSWQGYSTGKWVGNVLWVHTDHLKAAFLQRTDGLPLDDKTTMDERIFRYGDVLVDVMMISDPQYLSQPFIYSKLYYRIPQGNMDPYPCSAHNQVPAPEGQVPIHINLPSAVPVEILKALGSGAGPPAGLSADERAAFERLAFFFTHGLSYAQQMANHPQTLYAIADSPVGLAAWFLDHDLRSYQLIARTFDGQREGLTRDDVLDNLTLTWLTNTAISSSRLYRENKLPFFVPMGVAIPVAVSAFPDELFQAPKSWVERAYPKLIHYNKVDKGGHFAA